MNRLEEIIKQIQLYLNQTSKEWLTAKEAGDLLGLERSNTSRYLNSLVKAGQMTKVQGRPVKFYLTDYIEDEKVQVHKEEHYLIDQLIGAQTSLTTAIQQAKAAMMYPPNGLHTLILGETGVGKSMFAEIMYVYGKEIKRLAKEAPFIRFNCADYAENPQLLNAQIFGVKKGAYSGADQDREGIIKQADGGLLFLDEVHRLSKQGQEMLFTFIDKGEFRRLGEADQVHHSHVQLICATTEATNSFMLKTFLRRIPMSINLPTLSERSINERYQLITEFIIDESERIKKNIYVDKNALIAMILYKCSHNIGQLKGDIQLSCAKAFLKYKSHEDEFIVIQLSDLPQRVQEGLMQLKQNRKELDGLLSHQDDVIRFSKEENKVSEVMFSYGKTEAFYDLIDDKIEHLKQEGLTEQSIKETITLDLESHFNQYMNDVPTKLKHNDIQNIVDQSVVDFTHHILELASKELNRTYDDHIIYALMLHLNATIERIRLGKVIYHPKLNQIRVEFPDEFMVAMTIVKALDERFNILTPLDEIGYITMFLKSEEDTVVVEKEDQVGVIVVMHGNTTATSMVDVVNELLGVQLALGVDMPLNMNPKEVYENVKALIDPSRFSNGLVLMVDMGSLHSFGNLLEKELGIQVKTIKDVTTSTVMAVTRKASIGRDINDVITGFHVKKSRYTNLSTNKNIIVTACFTGEGAGRKLREIIKSHYDAKGWIEIVTLNYLDRKAFTREINKLNSEVNLMAIVGTVNVDIETIPYISAVDALTGVGLETLDRIVELEEIYHRAAVSLKEHIQSTDIFKLMKDLRRIFTKIEEELSIVISKDAIMGILLHTCFLIDRVLKGEDKKEYRPELLYDYHHEMIVIQRSFKVLEHEYDITIDDAELQNLCRMIVENK